MKKIIYTLILLLSLVLSGCASNNTTAENEDGKSIIYTTVYPLQFFAQEIGGDYVETKSIYPPGTDEHTFEPSQKDMISLADADLFVYIGLGLEGFVEKAKDTLKNEDVTLISAGENVSIQSQEHEEEDHGDHTDHEEHDHEHDHEGHDHEEHDGHNHGDIDPHVWLNPQYAKELADSIKNALIEKMPEHKAVFEENYETLTRELETLDQEFKTAIEAAPKKEILVSHAAYGYWEERYGIEQISVSGLSTSNEPSQKQLQNIIEEAKEHQLEYIFFEQNVSSKLTEIIRTEIGAEALTLHNLAVLTDQDIQNESDYFTLMKENLKHLEKALQ
ncbi:metal ABC transporter solute-binding protein, Zn/Mn family [Cytobacillus gottheilii]|uniref:Zinc ABC transporter substrate-binding protein n=1 Tax=Cytobacillus gottheilii TaxID=859144 RepID=A0ABX8FAF8_9BACI|nr:zinc ABC transporter substrate-binding protein [Cytobacillus gottheilii]QVY60803.1 zinc ABC transporter substrate-binding protein [Cytobacillus gottheilii]